MKLAQSLGEEFYGQGHPLMSLTGISSLVSALTSNLFTIGGVIFVFVIIFADLLSFPAQAMLNRAVRRGRAATRTRNGRCCG